MGKRASVRPVPLQQGLEAGMVVEGSQWGGGQYSLEHSPRLPLQQRQERRVVV
jgi:hypothetical protein